MKRKHQVPRRNLVFLSSTLPKKSLATENFSLTEAYPLNKSCFSMHNCDEAEKADAGKENVMNPDKPLNVAFFKTEQGREPVREWLKELSREDRKMIGEDIKAVQYGWPLGFPLVRKLEAGLWEIRTELDRRIARVTFSVYENQIVLLHGFIKKSQKTPQNDLDISKKRSHLVRGGYKHE